MIPTTVLLLLMSAFQTSSASADVGLLLGFRGGSTLDRAARYRTLWITRVEGRVEQEGEWRTIIVPRGDTFCEVEVRPLMAALYTHAAVGAHCEQKLQAPTDTSEPPDCTGYNNVDVLFVSPSYISLERHEESVCNGRANSYYTLSTTTLTDYVEQWRVDRGRALSARHVFGSEALEAFREAAELECVRWTAMGPYDGVIPELPTCDGELVPDWFSNWAVKRAGRRWSVVGRVQAWRSNFTDYLVPIDLPRKMVSALGRDPLQDLAVPLPPAEDVLLSPDGGLAALVDRVSVRVFSISDSGIGEPELTIPIRTDERVILVEWAIGDDVQVWTDRLTHRFNTGQ